ncbi:choline transport protein [Ceratobasidium sp. AG-Ba]|nr:choline transport protein [Ceratobasidium sp. AG-Ba]
MSKSLTRQERSFYNLELLERSRADEPVIVRAVAVSKGLFKENPKAPADLQFDLSSVVGNDNGSFKWGRAAFQLTGSDFSLVQDKVSGTFLLSGKLWDMQQNEKPAKIDLDKKLKVDEYIDPISYETYHRLVEREATPPERTLVLCFDGTSNKFGDQNTNVIKLVELLKKNDPSRQMVYYQTGIGTYAPPGLTTTFGLRVAEQADKAVAWYLYQHVIDGYKFLMQNYRIGDSISIFGFSRGAFTARALAGMLHSVGLLPKDNVEHIPFAYEAYKLGQDKTNPNNEPSYITPIADGAKDGEFNPGASFRRAFCIPVKIDFVGVWDTVASVGAIIPKTLPWIAYNPSIRVFRQALALDERRGNFIPSVWDHRHTNPLTQDVREVWFRGGHCDVGGGSSGPAPTATSMLSNIPLRWMIRQIIACDTGILFDYISLDRYREEGILERPPYDTSKGEHVWDDRIKESSHLDDRDSNNGASNIFRWNPLWNPLEYLPVPAKPIKIESFKPNGEFEAYVPSTSYWPNAKSGRSIYRSSPTDPIFLHSSVVRYLILQNAETGLDYKPHATWYGYSSTERPPIEEIGDLKDEPDAYKAMDSRLKKIDHLKTKAANKWGWGLF